MKYEKLVKRISCKTSIIKNSGRVNIYNYKNKLEKNTNYVITKGKFNKKKSVPVRVLSTKIKHKNILNNKKIKKSLKHLTKYNSFLFLIINNQDTNHKDSSISTLRYYGIGAQIIKDLNVKNMILISRSRKNYWSRRLCCKKTSNHKMKKILIINSNYYKNILEFSFRSKKITQKI